MGPRHVATGKKASWLGLVKSQENHELNGERQEQLEDQALYSVICGL